MSENQVLDAELNVVGSLFLEPKLVHTVIEKVDLDAFTPPNNHIVSAIEHIIKGESQQFKRVGTMTVWGVLQQRKKRVAQKDIRDIISNVVTTEDFEDSINIVADAHVRKKMEDALKSIKIQIESHEDLDNIISSVDLFRRNTNDQISRFVHQPTMKDHVDKTDAQIKKIIANRGTMTGIPSGYPRLDHFTGGFQKELIVIGGRPSMGKCLGKGTKVLMYSGELKNVEDIKVNDLLMGVDSKPRKVLSLARGREEMYWVRQNKAIDYRVNKSHILSLKRSRTENRHKHGDVLNISIGEYLNKANKFKSNYKGYKVPVEFKWRKTKIEPYFLGLWLGDGSKENVKITTADIEVIEYIKSYSKRLGLQVTKYNGKNRCSDYSITNGKIICGRIKFSLQKLLRNEALINNKHIPNNYLINSKKNRLELLAGLIDSNGYYSKKYKGYEITQKNQNLAKQIKFLCDSLGFRTSLISKKATIKSIGYESEVYRIRFSGGNNMIPTKIKRKKTQKIVSNSQTGIKIEYDKVDDYYGFEIDGNKLFLLEDMTVTHNTAFMLNVCSKAVQHYGYKPGFFSYEMTTEALLMRMICSDAQVSSHHLKHGGITESEEERLTKYIKLYKEMDMYIDDAQYSIDVLISKIETVKERHGIDFAVVDYLQLIPVKGRTREEEISYMTRTFKGLVKRLSMPIILISQLSRLAARKGGKPPTLDDLRESGAIEQDADVVIFPHRPFYYGIRKKDGKNMMNVAEMHIAKQRNGPTGVAELVWNQPFACFQNPAGRWKTAGHA